MPQADIHFEVVGSASRILLDRPALRPQPLT